MKVKEQKAPFPKWSVSGWAALVVVSVFVADVAGAAENLPSGDVDDDVVESGVDEGVYDPFEVVNRPISDFNRFFRAELLDPVVDAYQYVTPDPVERSVSNFFSNLREPVTVVSSLMQGDMDNVGTSVTRLAINTTIGVVGLFDEATEMGFEKREEDLGQAFGAHGVAPGPHIVLPILGPTNLRDGLGTVVESALNPIPTGVGAADRVVQYSGAQDQIRNAVETALDPYALERGAYEAIRQNAVNNGVDSE